MRVLVMGLGYVGTVTAAGLASAGHDVVGVDVDELKVDAVRRGISPVVEPGLDRLIDEAVASGRLSVSSDVISAMEGADLTLICVGTPSGRHGSTELTYVERALIALRDAMREATPPASGHHAVIIRSTVPPGTGKSLVDPLFEADLVPSGWSVSTGMCPEFLREGVGVSDFFAPPFVVIGASEQRTCQLVDELFGFLGQGAVHVAVETAEALKFACNAFHAVKVSFANEIARVFRPLGVDSREVMEIFCQDTKLNIAPTYLRPGFAFGGSCLPKDLRSIQHLARANGVEVPLLIGTTRTNEVVIRDLFERIEETGLRKVCLVGLSFKPDTDDLRESPNVELAERLIGRGYDVRIYDPIVNPNRLTGANLRHVEAKLPHLNRLLSSDALEALTDAEIVILASSADMSLNALMQSTPRVIFDLHGRFGPAVESLPGYEGVAW